MAFSVRVAWIAVQTFGLLVTFHLLFVCVPALRRRADPQLAAHFACVGNIVQTTYFGMLLSIALP